MDYSIEFDKQILHPGHIFKAWKDVLYGNNLDIRQRLLEYKLTLFNEIIDLKTSKQKTISTRFTEVEPWVISKTAKKLFGELFFWSD